MWLANVQNVERVLQACVPESTCPCRTNFGVEEMKCQCLILRRARDEVRIHCVRKKMYTEPTSVYTVPALTMDSSIFRSEEKTANSSHRHFVEDDELEVDRFRDQLGSCHAWSSSAERHCKCSLLQAHAFRNSGCRCVWSEPCDAALRSCGVSLYFARCSRGTTS